MMVFSRKKGESFVINDNITVKVAEIRGDKVRLEVTYPKDVSVHRQEIADVLREAWEKEVARHNDECIGAPD